MIPSVARCPRFFVATLLVLLMTLALASPASAATTRSGDHVLIGPNETIDDDVFLSGTTMDVLGHVRGDLIAIGTEATVAGEVDGDLIALASTVNVTGTVHGSVRGLAQTLTVKGQVGRNVLALAQDLETGPQSDVGGSVTAAAGTLTLGGSIHRGVDASASQTTLDAQVGRDVNVSTVLLTVAPTAHVGGRLRYVSNQTATIPSGVAAGGVTRVSPSSERGSQQAADAAAAVNVLSILWLVGTLLLGVLAVHFLPSLARGSRAALTRRPLTSLGLGALLCVSVPLGSLVAAITVIGLPLAIVAIALLVAGLQVGWVFAAAGLAGALAARVQQGPPTAPPEVLVIAGVLVLWLLTRLPMLGGFVWIVVVFLGAGALAQAVVTREGELEAVVR